MNVPLSHDIEAKLARLAAECGQEAEDLAREAIERFVNYEESFIAEVEKGLAQISEGKLLTHEQVVTRIEKKLSNRLPVT
jgi:predicted transcriptional regulator